MEGRVRKSRMPREVIALGQRIELLIKQGNKKTREVAHDAGLDVENLRKYIKGKQEMKVSTLIKIANALEVSPCDILSEQAGRRLRKKS